VERAAEATTLDGSRQWRASGLQLPPDDAVELATIDLGGLRRARHISLVGFRPIATVFMRLWAS